MEGPEEPKLGREDVAALRTGVEQFNAGLYFECHDTLEEVWSGTRGEARDFFQGLIQVAVACYHVSNGNVAGARSLLPRALKRLQGYPERYLGVDLGSVRAQAEDLQVRLARGELPAAERPRWRIVPPAAAPPNPLD